MILKTAANIGLPAGRLLSIRKNINLHRQRQAFNVSGHAIPFQSNMHSYNLVWTL